MDFWGPWRPTTLWSECLDEDLCVTLMAVCCCLLLWMVKSRDDLTFLYPREGDLRVIRPFVYAREKDLRSFADKVSNPVLSVMGYSHWYGIMCSTQVHLPVIPENCPACFEAPKVSTNWSHSQTPIARRMEWESGNTTNQYFFRQLVYSILIIISSSVPD